MFDTDDELAEQDNTTKGTLGHIAKQRLGVILREVTFQRGTIARAMAFAIDHSDAATEVLFSMRTPAYSFLITNYFP